MGLFSELAGLSVKQLMKKGYPEEVAIRIHSGELPMDEASIAKRIEAGNFGEVNYRGHSRDMPPESNQDMWLSSSEDVAEGYAKSRTNGEVTPVRTNADNLADVNARGAGWRGVSTNNRKVEGIETGVHKGTDRISEAVKDSGEYQGTRFRNIKDEATGRGGEQADTINVLGSRDDVQIRHRDAAYDPQYKGDNIRGFADPRLLAITAAGSAGALGALSSQDAEAKPSLLLRKGIDAVTAGRQIKNKINKEGGDPARVVQRFVHENTNYDNGFTSLARRWDQGRNGDAYVFGIKKMAYDLLQGTDDPQVRQAVMGWLTPRLQRAALPVAGIGMSQAALANPEVKDSGHISAPRSGMLHDITMGLRDVERRVQGSPAQVLFPEGLTQYLETVNRRTEDPNATTRMFAALDVIPF
jgi:hypothetical protein